MAIAFHATFNALIYLPPVPRCTFLSEAGTTYAYGPTNGVRERETVGIVTQKERVTPMNGSTKSTAQVVPQFTVLVVDPDPRAMSLTASHIEARMHAARTIAASSYTEARASAKHKRVDFIVFACDGPPADWEHILADLSRSCPQASIVLTGRGHVSAEEHGAICGFFRKPYRVDDLVAVMESVRGSGCAASGHSQSPDG